MSNAEQLEYWNGEAGERWAQQDEMMARVLAPVAQRLLDHADLAGCTSALDVGCGGGSQTALLAQRLGEGAKVTGVDISAPLLAVARDRSGQLPPGSAAMDFIEADASEFDFAGNDFDLLFSRFGVMFFDDPIAAFSNMGSAMRPGARLAFACWQSLQNNPWLFEPLQAALTLLPPPEPPAPNAPGPFALADPERVSSILSAAGFVDIALESAQLELRFDGAPTLRENAAQLIQIGPINGLLEGQQAVGREQVVDLVADVIAPYWREDALLLPGSVWMVTAGFQGK